LERLGALVSTSPATIQKIETGKNWVSAAMLQRLSEAFQVPVYCLFEGAPERRLDDPSSQENETGDEAMPRREVTNELLFETLKAIRHDISELKDDVREVKTRTGVLEAQYASLSNRVDRIDDRLARVEARFGAGDA
jgi:Helix-turn-helix.